jgi:hypothetical protein
MAGLAGWLSSVYLVAVPNSNNGVNHHGIINDIQSPPFAFADTSEVAVNRIPPILPI